MTSWNRGREHEEEGERKMEGGDLDNHVQGAVQKAAGEAEQGLDNVRDTVAGRQDDLQGKDRNPEAERRNPPDSVDA